MKKKVLSISAALVVIAAAAFFIMTPREEVPGLNVEDLLAPPAAADFYDDSNRLTVDKGTVTVTRADETTENVIEETRVSIGDTISVAENSEATLYWFDDSISRLDAGTEITIDKADYNPENINEVDINFEVIKGGVWSKVQNLVDEDSEFLSYSGGVVAGVRGSTYNFLVTGTEVAVEAIRHGAFIGERTATGIARRKPIASGSVGTAVIERLGVTDDLDVFEVEEIAEFRWDSSEFQENLERDKVATNEIWDRNIERMKQRIGALPGEEGYEEKQKLIREHIESIADPTVKSKLLARRAQLRVQESLVGAMTKGEVIKVAARLEGLNKKELGIIIANADRILDVKPDQKELYLAKSALQNWRINAETDSGKQKRLRERALELKLYDLYELTNRKDLNPQELEVIFGRNREELIELKTFIENRAELAALAERMTERLEGRAMDIETLKFLREQFRKRREEALAPVRVIAPVRVQEPPTEEIIKEAPFHQGDSPI